MVSATRVIGARCDSCIGPECDARAQCEACIVAQSDTSSRCSKAYNVCLVSWGRGENKENKMRQSVL